MTDQQVSEATEQAAQAEALAETKAEEMPHDPDWERAASLFGDIHDRLSLIEEQLAAKHAKETETPDIPETHEETREEAHTEVSSPPAEAMARGHKKRGLVF